MNIPEEIVEKAARALYEDTDHWQQRGVPWDKCGQPRRDYFHHKARAALSAAAPHLMAQAWDEGNRHGINKHCESGCYEDATNNPYRKEAL